MNNKKEKRRYLNITMNKLERDFFYDVKQRMGYEKASNGAFLEHVIDMCTVRRIGVLNYAIEKLEEIDKDALDIKEDTGKMLRQFNETGTISEEDADNVCSKLAELDKKMETVNNYYTDLHRRYVTME